MKDTGSAVVNVNVPHGAPPNYMANGYANNGWDPMDVTSQEYDIPPPMDIQMSPIAQEYPNQPPMDLGPLKDPVNLRSPDVQANGLKLKTLGSLVSLEWRLSKFGNNDKVRQLPPVEGNIVSSGSKPSLKLSSSTDNRSNEIPPKNLTPRNSRREQGGWRRRLRNRNELRPRRYRGNR